jgi:hypothetical protein
MARRNNARHCISRDRLVERKRKWTADRDTAIGAAILEVFGQQQGAILQLCRTDDQAVPPTEVVALLDLPGASWLGAVAD